VQDHVLGRDDTVRVQVLVGADGVPVSAHGVRGDRRNFGICEKAALQWRFLVPESLKARAPLAYYIDFSPLLLP
jgi:hypothetical protein